MNKIWLQQYPEGIPADVDIDEYASLKEIVEDSCKRFAELPAYGNMGVSITYRQLERASREFGAYLQKVIGMRKGDRVAIMLPNLLQYPVALFGTLRAGMTVVNVNPMYTARELQHQLKDSGATAIVVLENFAHTLQEVLPATPIKAVITTQIGDLFPQPKALLTNLVVKHVKKMVPPWRIPNAIEFGAALQAGRAQTLDDVPLGHDDIAFLQYTGGTTGVAKGAILTHRNLVANVQQLAAWIARDLLDGKETALLPLPLYHVYALTANLVFMKIGAHIILITNPRDLPAFVKELGDAQVHRHGGGQYAVQRAAQRAGFRPGGAPQPQDGQRRRHGRAARGGREVEAGHRRAHHGSLWAHGNVAGRDRQPPRPRGLVRDHRRADPVDRSRGPG